ncbi:MAG: hypothetical protein ABH816_00280 [Candidatus Levyibacteriota bacterium]
MEQISQTRESWNIKRIILGLIVIGIFIGLCIGSFKVLKLDVNKYVQKPSSNKSLGTVEGVSIKSNETDKDQNVNFSLPLVNTLQTDVSQKIKSIQNEANNLNLEEIASSSPQMQKVVNDIRSLGNYPKNQAKEMCQKICDGI